MTRLMSLAALTLVLTACTTSSVAPTTVATTAGGRPQTTTTTAPPDTSPSSTTSTPEPVPSTPEPATPTTLPDPDVPFVAVAWESAAKLVVFRATDGFVSCGTAPSGSDCGPLLRVAEVDVPSRPHNVAAHGSVVLVTHPRAGQITRYDVATGELLSKRVGREPHDVKFSGDGSLAYVADEDGRRLLVVDPGSLEIVSEADLAGKPHDLAVGPVGELWITLIGHDVLAKVVGDSVELFPTGGSPHDLIVAPDGRIWFSNWNSDELNVFDPRSGTVEDAPAGVHEPHHFTIAPDGSIWVSDNGGSGVVGFTEAGLVEFEVGPTPHHLAFLGDLLVVAVSGTGEVVAVSGGQIFSRAGLSPGLHGVSVGATPARG